MNKRKIIKNSFLEELQKSVEETKTEETQVIEYLSNFDFESNEFTEAEKRFVQEREKILVVECKKNSDSLYNICMSMQEISDFFKNNNSGKFMAWYKSAGFTKDRVSELLKRADLYIKFPEKKNLISSLSILAIKVLTNQLVTHEQQEKVLELEYTSVEDIKNNIVIENKQNKLIEVPSKFKYFNPKSIDKIHKDIKKMTPKDIFEAKKEIEYYKKLINETIKDLEQQEKEFENKDNLKLVEVK